VGQDQTATILTMIFSGFHKWPVQCYILSREPLCFLLISYTQPKSPTGETEVFDRNLILASERQWQQLFGGTQGQMINYRPKRELGRKGHVHGGASASNGHEGKQTPISLSPAPCTEQSIKATEVLLWQCNPSPLPRL